MWSIAISLRKDSTDMPYSKPCVTRPLSKRPKIGFQDHLSLSAGQSIAECPKGSILKYIRPSLSYHFVIKIFVLSIFKWPFYTDFTVCTLIFYISTSISFHKKPSSPLAMACHDIRYTLPFAPFLRRKMLKQSSEND